jgi:hypothetical protein
MLKTKELSCIQHNFESVISKYRLERAKEELHFVEMTKFKIEKPHSLRTRFEKWLHVLKFGDILYSVDKELTEELIEYLSIN